MFAFLYEVQNAIRGSLSEAIEGFAASGDWNLLFAMMPLGIVFGAAHAMTPGHSKSVLATYVLGSGLSPLRAVVTSLILAATHICSAVLLAVVANTLVTRTLVGAGRAPALENISRYMLVAIGVWLVCVPGAPAPISMAKAISQASWRGSFPARSPCSS